MAKTRRARKRDQAVAAQAAELHLLQHAQQLDLGEEAQIADFIQEERAVGGLLEVAFARSHRAGEGALLMAEQLGFDQRLWNGAAGDGNKGPVGARAQIVNGAGNQLLAGSAFAGHQHRGIQIGDAMHQLINPLHLRTGANHLVATGGHIQLLLHRLQLLPQRGVLIRPAEHGLEIANRGRPAAVAKGAGANQFKGGGTKPVVGHNHGGNLRGDQALGTADALLQRIVIGMQVQDHDIAVAGGA